MRRQHALVGIALMLLVSLVGCARPPSDLTALSLPMGYVANVQFSPFYVAQEKGYLADAGFDVTFDYRWETDGIQLVAAGEIPFSIASGDQVIQARSQGLPVVAIAGWYQTFPVGLIALEGVPLDRPEDLRGLRIGIPETFGASYIGLRALLDVAGLTEDDIDLQAIGYAQLAALTAGTVDAVVVYANNEPVVLAQEGTTFNEIYAADYLNLVSAVIVSSDAHIAADPEGTRQFVHAFLRGLGDVLADPDAAFDTCLDFVEGLEDHRTVQRAVLDGSIELWEAPQLGVMSDAAWEQAQNVMAEAGLIETISPVEQLFTNEFVIGD